MILQPQIFGEACTTWAWGLSITTLSCSAILVLYKKEKRSVLVLAEHDCNNQPRQLHVESVGTPSDVEFSTCLITVLR